MSNYSYLYAIRPADHGKREHILIAQCPYETPLLFLLLCSAAPTQVATRAFRRHDALGKIAILADFTDGVARTIEFLEACRTLNSQCEIIPAAQFEMMSAQVRDILKRVQDAGCTQFLLEAGEVLFMLCTDSTQATRRLLIEAQHAPDAATERLRAIFLEPFVPCSEQDEIHDGFYVPDFDHMSDAEYFQFMQEDFSDADAVRPPAEKLEKLGFGYFRLPGSTSAFHAPEPE